VRIVESYYDDKGWSRKRSMVAIYVTEDEASRVEDILTEATKDSHMVANPNTLATEMLEGLQGIRLVQDYETGEWR